MGLFGKEFVSFRTVMNNNGDSKIVTLGLCDIQYIDIHLKHCVKPTSTFGGMGMYGSTRVYEYEPNQIESITFVSHTTKSDKGLPITKESYYKVRTLLENLDTDGISDMENEINTIESEMKVRDL